MPLSNHHVTVTLIQVRIGRHRRALGAMDNTLDTLNTGNGKLLYKLQPGLGVTKAQAQITVTSQWTR